MKDYFLTANNLPSSLKFPHGGSRPLTTTIPLLRSSNFADDCERWPPLRLSSLFFCCWDPSWDFVYFLYWWSWKKPHFYRVEWNSRFIELSFIWKGSTMSTKTSRDFMITVDNKLNNHHTSSRPFCLPRTKLSTNPWTDKPLITGIDFYRAT